MTRYLSRADLAALTASGALAAPGTATAASTPAPTSTSTPTSTPTTRAAIDAIERIHADISDGTAHQPAPVSMHVPGSTTRIIPMTAMSSRLGLSAVKVLADVPDNRTSGRGLPTQRSTIVLTDIVTGECVAILDGMVPTRERTAAASAVATRHLARADANTLGLVGAGALAIAHTVSHDEVMPLDRVVVWSRSPETVERFRTGVAAAGIRVPIVAASEVRQVVDDADVLCTLTPSRDPIVLGEWLHEGQHVNAVGAPPRPDHREIDGMGMARSRVVVDSSPTAFAKSGEVLVAVAEGLIAASHVEVELGDVITGRAVGRRSADEITLFDSVGIGAQDLAIGSMYLDLATAAGLGLDLTSPGVCALPLTGGV